MREGSIGAPLDRVDGRAKVTGRALYVGDVVHPELAHAVVVQSTVAKGRVERIETRAAEKAPGVLAVITHLNAPKLSPSPIAIGNEMRGGPGGSAGQSHLPLQDDVVYHSGQHVALVVARTLEEAQRAASLVAVSYTVETPAVEIESELPRAFKPKKVWGEETDTAKGDVELGLKEAAVRVDETYTTALQHHVAMEPHATVAVWDEDKLTLYEPSTWVYGVRKTASHWFDIPEEKVRVVQQFVGGSFGCKGPTWEHVALAAMAARQLDRPVKLVLTRQQTFTSVGHRPRIIHRVRLGVTRDGRLTALAHDAVSHTSPFDDRVVAPVTKTSRKLYACPNVSTSYRLVHLNMPGPFTMRGPGETPGLFAVESAMDELSYALGVDPIELRLRNYAEVDPESDKPWSSKSLRECYRRGAERFGWSRRDPRPRSMRDGEHLVGMGMASMAYDAKSAPASARAVISADGGLLVQSATCEQGTGSYTVFSQVAAEESGVSVERIRFELGDTFLPEAPISAGSQTVASVGAAVQEATRSLRRKLLALASADSSSPIYEKTEDEVAVENGRFFVKTNPNVGQTYAEILRRAGKGSFEVTETVKPGEETEKYTRYSFGAHFAEVRVHPALGEVRVARYTAAFGAGRIMNAKTARSQLLGGIIWGIGMALMEETFVDGQFGRIVNSDLAEYHVPTNADVPDMDAFFVEEDDDRVNKVGAKGVGEIGTVGAAAAIANAVFHATGVRVRELPITPDKLL